MNSRQQLALRLGIVTFLSTAFFTPSNDSVHAATNSAPSPQLKQLTFNQHTSSVYAIVHQNTTYMPIWYVMKALKSAGFTSTWNGSTWNLTVPSQQKINWGNLQLGSGNALIELNGIAVKHVQPLAIKDPYSGKATAYMPIWYVMKALDRSGVASDWNGDTWSLTWPAVAKTTEFKKIIFASDTFAASTDIQSRYPTATSIATSAYHVTTTGQLSGSGLSTVENAAKRAGKAAFARISLSDKATLANLLGNSERRNALVNTLAEHASASDVGGINIDFEFMPPAERTNFVSFLIALHTKLAANGQTLSVDLPAVINATKDTWDEGYNFSAIGHAVDAVIIMAYDDSYPTSAPGPIAPYAWVQSAVQYATSQIENRKIVLGIDTYGYDWGTGKATALSLNAIQTFVSAHSTLQQWDSSALSPFYTYQQNGVKHTVFYETPQSIAAKLPLVSQYQLAGIAVWRAGLETGNVAQVINQFPT